MHNWAKKIMECLKAKVEGIGIDNIEGQDLEELKTWACIAREIAEYDYYYHIIEAMEDENNEYGRDYDEDGVIKGYRGRSARTGRYVHRGYEEQREMDRMNNRMYTERGYVEGTMRPNEMPLDKRGYEDMAAEHNRGYSEGKNRGYEEGYTKGYTEGKMGSHYEMAKRGYEEAKKKNEGEADKTKQRERLQHLMDTLDMELKPFAPTMDSTEKQIVRNGAQKIINSYS